MSHGDTAMKILIADDHPLVRDAWARTVASMGASVDVFEAADHATARRIAGEQTPDLAIVDLNMRDGDGITGIRSLRAEFPTLPVVVASAQEDAQTIRRVLACGVSGFIPKSESCAVILQALRLIQAGGVYVPPHVFMQPPVADREVPSAPASGPDPALTPRQLEVLDRLLLGRPNKLIARDLGLTEGTVKIHISAILRSLGVVSRTGAVVRAQALGLVATRR